MTSITVCKHQQWRQTVLDCSGFLPCPKGSRTCDFLLWEGWKRAIPVCVHDKPLDSKVQLDARHCSLLGVTGYTQSPFHLPYVEPHDWQSAGWTTCPVQQFLLLMAEKDRDETNGEKIWYFISPEGRVKFLYKQSKLFVSKVLLIFMFISLWSNTHPIFFNTTNLVFQ